MTSQPRYRVRLRSKIVDLWHQTRNDLVGNERFQRFAASFFLTRRVARQRAKSVFDLCAGFVYSQILYACIKLDLLGRLREGPMPLENLAAAMDLPREAAERLLMAAIALDLVDRRGETSAGEPRFGLAMQGAALLANPGAIAMIEHHKMLYDDLSDPVALLRGEAGPTQLSTYWAYATSENPGGLGAAPIREYTGLMGASQPLVSADIIHAYDFGKHRKLLDIGGGDGTFLREVAKSNPALGLMLFDLPPVAAKAQDAFAEAGLSARAECIGGDFKRDPLPSGTDAVSLIRVLHDHDDAVVIDLLAKIHAALPDGGALIVGEPMSEEDGAKSVGDAYFGFYLLAMGSGKPRSASRLAALLSNAGFAQISSIRTRRPMLTGLMTARKSGNRPSEL